MSDHEHDHHEPGGHEVDRMPSRRLFNLLFGLSGLTLLACIGVVQLFYRQVDSIENSRAAKVSFQLDEYRNEMEALKGNWQAVYIQDDDGLPTESKDGSPTGLGVHESLRYHMPLSEARKRMIDDPSNLKAAPAYRGWVDPDPKAAELAKPEARMPRGANNRGPAIRRPTQVPARPMPPAGAPGAAPGRPAAPAGAVVAPTGDSARQPARPTPTPAEGKAPARPAAPPKPAPAADGKAPQ